MVMKRTQFKTKKTTQRTLCKQADKLWSQAIRLRDKDICQKCKRPGNNPHHIFTRSIKHMRHLISNGVCLCAGCHTLGRESAHKGPEAFRDWLIEYLGEAEFEMLKRQSQMVIKPDYNLSVLFLKDFIEKVR